MCTVVVHTHDSLFKRRERVCVCITKYIVLGTLAVSKRRILFSFFFIRTIARTHRILNIVNLSREREREQRNIVMNDETRKKKAPDF